MCAIDSKGKSGEGIGFGGKILSLRYEQGPTQYGAGSWNVGIEALNEVIAGYININRPRSDGNLSPCIPDFSQLSAACKLFAVFEQYLCLLNSYFINIDYHTF